MKEELVQDWMTTNVITISITHCLPEAHELMTKHHIRRLPVVDEDGRLAGIVTLGDVRGAEPSQATSLSMWELNYLISKLCVKDLMTANPVTIHQTATIGEAARIMLDYKVSGLPVVDENDHVVGIITESDIFRMVVRHTWLREPEATPDSTPL
jgi:CBS domain-containing protein